jgi:hypothetical protein
MLFKLVWEASPDMECREINIEVDLPNTKKNVDRVKKSIKNAYESDDFGVDDTRLAHLMKKELAVNVSLVKLPKSYYICLEELLEDW